MTRASDSAATDAGTGLPSHETTVKIHGMTLEEACEVLGAAGRTDLLVHGNDDETFASGEGDVMADLASLGLSVEFVRSGPDGDWSDNRRAEYKAAQADVSALKPHGDSATPEEREADIELIRSTTRFRVELGGGKRGSDE